MALYHPDKDGIFPPDGEVVFAWTKDMKHPHMAICAAHDEYGWYGVNGHPIKGEVVTWTIREKEYWKSYHEPIERKDIMPIMSWTDNSGTRHEVFVKNSR